MRTRYQIAGPDVVHENFGGDLVVLDLATGRYFGLNAAGAALWEAITAGMAPADLGANAEDFAARLEEFGLIRASQIAPEAARPLMLDGLPTIEVYDDLADLIVADPIHDVDAEAGWPKMPDGAR